MLPAWSHSLKDWEVQKCLQLQLLTYPVVNNIDILDEGFLIILEGNWSPFDEEPNLRLRGSSVHASSNASARLRPYLQLKFEQQLHRRKRTCVRMSSFRPAVGPIPRTPWAQDSGVAQWGARTIALPATRDSILPQNL